MMSRVPQRFLRFLSDALALIWFNVDKRHRTVVVNNVQHAFPGKFSQSQALQFAKQNFKHTAGLIFEGIWSYGRNKEELLKHFKVEGKEHLDAALADGGVILLGCHMGNFELMAAGVAKAGLRPVGLYRKLDFEPMERLTREMRERFGSTMIPIRKAAPKVKKALAQGKMVATLLDQNVDWYKGVFVDFFGQPACTNNGLAKLAVQSGAKVIPMFIMKEGDTYIQHFLPEVPVVDTKDPIKNIEINTQAFVSAIETMVRQCPEQYFWVHNRWKTKPFCLIPQE